MTQTRKPKLNNAKKVMGNKNTAKKGLRGTDETRFKKITKAEAHKLYQEHVGYSIKGYPKSLTDMAPYVFGRYTYSHGVKTPIKILDTPQSWKNASINFSEFYIEVPTKEPKKFPKPEDEYTKSGKARVRKAGYEFYHAGENKSFKTVSKAEAKKLYEKGKEVWGDFIDYYGRRGVIKSLGIPQRWENVSQKIEEFFILDR